MTTTIETRRMTVEGNPDVGAGRRERRAGEAVVFVHGNPDAGSDWMPLMTRVADFATVVAPLTFPGSGVPTSVATATTPSTATPVSSTA